MRSSTLTTKTRQFAILCAFFWRAESRSAVWWTATATVVGLLGTLALAPVPFWGTPEVLATGLVGIATSVVSVALCLRTAQTAIGPALALANGGSAAFAAIAVRAGAATVLVGIGAALAHLLFHNMLSDIGLYTLVSSGMIAGAGLGLVLASWGTLIAALIGPQFAPWGTAAWFVVASWVSWAMPAASRVLLALPDLRSLMAPIGRGFEASLVNAVPHLIANSLFAAAAASLLVAFRVQKHGIAWFDPSREAL